MKIKKLTEEEIKELPYPDAARMIGGVFELSDNSPSEEQIKNFKKHWTESIRNSKMTFRTPIVEETK